MSGMHDALSAAETPCTRCPRRISPWHAAWAHAELAARPARPAVARAGGALPGGCPAGVCSPWRPDALRVLQEDAARVAAGRAA